MHISAEGCGVQDPRIALVCSERLAPMQWGRDTRVRCTPSRKREQRCAGPESKRFGRWLHAGRFEPGPRVGPYSSQGVTTLNVSNIPDRAPERSPVPNYFAIEEAIASHPKIRAASFLLAVVIIGVAKTIHWAFAFTPY